MFAINTSNCRTFSESMIRGNPSALASRPKMPEHIVWLCVAMSAALASGCDKGSEASPPASAIAPTTTPIQAPTPASTSHALPEIIVESSKVSVGKEHVPAAPPGLTDRVSTLLDTAAMGGSLEDPESRPLEVVVMRSVKPSQVGAVVLALRHAKAKGAVIKTEARDGSTQKLALSFATSVPDCSTVAWIAKDAAIDVWPAGGGVAKRVIRGLAGPDITLGLEAIGARANACGASDLVIGGDEAMTWGLVFDLATSVLQAPGARARAAILVTTATPGRRVEL
jgi:hypothetical protein